MNAYLPHDWQAIAAVLLLLVLEVGGGYGLNRRPRDRTARWLAWLMTVAVTACVERITDAEPAGGRMVAIILALVYGMKAIVGVEAGAALPPWRWLGFCLLWFGMRPGLFARAGSEPRRWARSLLIQGFVRVVIGLVLILAAAVIWRARETTSNDEVARWLATAPLLVGLSLALHFGVFTILAAFWRALGVDARPLFRAPILSTSLHEFWSKRWNLAFSEMTALAIYRPATTALGRRGAIVAAFIVSGLLHELAISVPVKAGYGGPSLYFLLHGLLVSIETWLERRGARINSIPWLGRIWTLAALVLPLPILFHRPFLAGVVWPIIGID
jgi:alginate O-acetyltransferase complex protein AlgI